MRFNALHLVLAIVTLVIGAAAEELLPKPARVGFPVLLAAAQFMAIRRPTLPAALFAVSAGAVEDALSALPPMTSASFFLGVAMLTRWTELPRGVAALAYPLYQLWLVVWVSGLSGNVFGRLLVSAPIGLATAYATGALLGWVERRSSIDEAE